MQMVRLNGCMYGIGVSVERLVTSVPIDYAFGRCRMGSRGVHGAMDMERSTMHYDAAA